MASDPTPRGTGPEGKTQQKRKRVDEVPSADAGDDSANKRARLASDLHITSDEDKRALELVNSRCDVQIHSVISSSKIQKKITLPRLMLPNHECPSFVPKPPTPGS